MDSSSSIVRPTVVLQARVNQEQPQTTPTLNHPPRLPIRPPSPPVAFLNRGNFPGNHFNNIPNPFPIPNVPTQRQQFLQPQNIPIQRPPRHCRCSRCIRYNNGPPNPCEIQQRLDNSYATRLHDSQLCNQDLVQLSNRQEVEMIEQRERLQFAEYENDYLYTVVNQQKEEVARVTESLARQNQLFLGLQREMEKVIYSNETLSEENRRLKEKLQEEIEFMRKFNSEFTAECQLLVARRRYDQDMRENLMASETSRLEPVLPPGNKDTDEVTFERAGPHQVTIKRKNKTEDPSEKENNLDILENILSEGARDNKCGICGNFFPVHADLFRHFSDDHFKKR